MDPPSQLTSYDHAESINDIYHYGVLKLGPSCKIFMIHSLFQLLLVYRQ